MAVDGNKVVVELTHDEALVLFEWMARTDPAASLPVEHEAEQFVVWTIQNYLESVLAEPFDSSYKELVAAARERVRKLACGEQ